MAERLVDDNGVQDVQDDIYGYVNFVDDFGNFTLEAPTSGVGGIHAIRNHSHMIVRRR